MCIFTCALDCLSLSFSAALKDYKRVYERILEMDKRLDLTRKQLQTCEEKEKKLQKEMIKGPKEVGPTQDRLQQAVDAKNLAETERKYYIYINKYTQTSTNKYMSHACSIWLHRKHLVKPYFNTSQVSTLSEALLQH